MKPNVCLIIIWLFPFAVLRSASNDSLVLLSELHLKNSAERSAFTNLQRAGDNGDMVALFLSHFSKTTNMDLAETEERINACVAELTEKTQRQDEVKKVKTIYKEIHRRFLRQYKQQNSFSDIFEKGEYNCVSGSALYAIVLHKMGIPYQIMEAPNHVFLMAFPATHRIAIESTDPVHGYMKFSDSYIRKYIAYLLEIKLISPEEVSTKSPEQLFERYYYEKTGLTLRGLAAIQYANYASYHLSDDHTAQALIEIKRAYFVDNSDRNRHILGALLWNQVSEANYRNPRDVRNLAIFCRVYSGGDEKTGGKIWYEFARLTEEQLVSQSDSSGFSGSFHTIAPNIRDTGLLRHIAFSYHYEMARFGYNAGSNEAFELSHLKAAYALKPLHSDLRSLIKAWIARSEQNSQDIMGIMNRLDHFLQTFDYLKTDEQFGGIRLNVLLEAAWKSFAFQQAAAGENYIKSFEALSENNRNFAPSSQFVEKAYSAAASYYYKKGNTGKTREILKRGLQFAPGNYGLQARLKQAN